jgi:hypothetical protein
MKHLNKKFTYAGSKKGGGKPPPPKPPVLTPPRVGSYKLGASYQFSEAVDLICQGPIDGLCNRFGSRLDNSQLLQGIYLNGVPIEQSVSSEKIRVGESSFEGHDVETDIIARLKEIAKITSLSYENPRRQQAFETTMSVVKNRYGKYNNILEYETYYFNLNLLSVSGLSFSNSKPMSYWVRANLVNYHKGKQEKTKSLGIKKYGDQRWTKSSSQGGRYEWPLTQGQKFYNESCPYRALIDGSIKNPTLIMEYSPSWSHIEDEIFRTWKSFFSHGVCSPYSYGNTTCVQPYTQGGKEIQRNSVARTGLSDLININANKRGNTYEWEYLKKKLEAYGFKLSSGNFNSASFITQVKNKFGRASDFEIQNSNATSQQELAKPYIAFKYDSSYVLDGYTSANEYEFTNELDGTPLTNELDFILEEYSGNYDWYSRDKNSINMLIPVLDSQTGKWNGKIKGFYLNFINTEVKSKVGELTKASVNSSTKVVAEGQLKCFAMLNSEIEFYNKVTGLGVFKMPKITGGGSTKYNFLNVLAEYRDGSGPNQQTPLSFFKNIYLDRDIQKRLLGPFNVDLNRRMQSLWNFDADGNKTDKDGNPRQRSLIVSEQNSRSNSDGRKGIPEPNTIPKMAINLETGENEWLLAVEEGSSDKRPSSPQHLGFRSFNFSDWNSFKQDYNEKAQPVTHVIYNPNVESCYITLNIEGLWDTIHVDEKSWDKSKIVGSKMPTIVNFRVEVGYIAPQNSSAKGQFVKSYDRFFRVLSLIEGGAAVDIGNPDNINNKSQLSYVKQLYNDKNGNESEFSGSVIESFELPDPQVSQKYGFEQIFRERYIKVTKLSTESNSTLIQKTANLAKVTEIVPRTLNYPFSALVGTKLDSRTFGEIPSRSYDVRMKKVKIPSNYTPLNPGGTDKRYWLSAEDLENAGKSDQTRVYDGDWDGTFKLGWTDNPAWILYDLLTDYQIGLGDLIEQNQINKWQLYKIGRFCDAVDVNGYFEGVSDNIVQVNAAKGGRQPRYTCNTLFQRDIKVFDALNLVASNFKGLFYFTDSVVSFSDDRIKEPVMVFNNTNVVEGVFNYSALLKDEQYNALEVGYNDAEDDYQPKVEYLENEQDIRERGIIKTKIDAFGVTSRAQARRFGSHLLYKATQENENVSFSTGLEGILVRPGDLIIIEDELKTLTSNFGRVLGVNQENNSIRISDFYDDDNFEGYLTVYIPTGTQQIEDIEEILLQDRSRHDFFTLFNTPSAFEGKRLDGYYEFDSYQEGFRDKKLEGLNTKVLRDEYPFYTGEENGTKHFLWYSTQYTGWVFSTGEAFTHSTTYDKYISATSGETNGEWADDFADYDNSDLNYNWYRFTTVGDGRNTAESFNLSDKWLDLRETQGAIVDDDIKINETKQIKDIKIASGVAANEDSIGYTLYVDQNDESSIFTPLIPKGSIYRFKRKDTSDRVYKVTTINEEDSHSYEVIASQYKSGKYREIEETNFSDQSVYVNPYSEDYQVDQSKYFTLNTPDRVTWTARNISVLGGNTTVTIEGTWRNVKNATGYRLGIRPAFELDYTYYDTQETSFDFEEITANGQYRLSLQALGAEFDNNDYYTHYLDSPIYYTNLNIDSLQEDTVIEGAVLDGIIIN